MKNRKYIFVIGGVMSGVGKGITTSSIGTILKARGYKITAMKIDPYLNVDAGTMNPTEHGETFVLDSGLECDQDMGNYERFLDVEALPSENYMTSGMVYQSVINKERNLEYGGKCVEAVPHIPQEIIERIEKASRQADSEITLIEIGGTVGEYQNILFIEAARMMKLRNPENVMFVLVSYLPIPSKVGEMKTKPTQYAVRTLNSYGVQPDVIVARSETFLDKKRKEKIAISCNVPERYVISAPDIESIYEVPINFERDDLSRLILKKLGLKSRKSDLKQWYDLVENIKKSKKPVKIGMVGKYFGTGDFVLSDAYISVIEAVKHACYANNVKPKLSWINSEQFEKEPEKIKNLKEYDGVIVPGGFGSRGIEGKIKAIEFCRENKIPFLGLCYGMQLAVIEFSRHKLGLKDAHTTEVDRDTKNPVIDIMPEQKKNLEDKNYGATMRLGGYVANLKKGTIAQKAYGKTKISERHRHRWEVNPAYIEKIEKGGMIFSGKSPDGKLMEIIELPESEHPFFLATQFHPELKSSPLKSHSLFLKFIRVAIGK
ncbi:MAG: CTP synthetase [Candidatus Moranbacteria bacterium GW2011_GWE2_35_2-]|nr:MAG: CTP synthetase [Candidatus Moranbacteria bacterium GW2011_GWE2_35_2-]KKQ22076.1 MAG: CTP synthetase [Candidatus Moranbacteria bacterium GW2011_GWF2_37_11]KKQ29171.1 MAG: CTP synthetase [Candidatus Moranbacteria bacterium GW2011_GWD1_37_17]KKQ31156.1 MAG: CTP synthetase [Candidatus Moranbacteria bacterium GW2011_GWE1_37_24]KKQ47406.1 MAG: CTP synthetase [Candidatus Moranbacteria bacterium GW2011_GWD2_37_9]HBO16446.1 CTP synthase [Candidatus Moranbacteria bacterium]